MIKSSGAGFDYRQSSGSDHFIFLENETVSGWQSHDSRLSFIVGCPGLSFSLSLAGLRITAWSAHSAGMSLQRRHPSSVASVDRNCLLQPLCKVRLGWGGDSGIPVWSGFPSYSGMGRHSQRQPQWAQAAENFPESLCQSQLFRFLLQVFTTLKES